MIPESQQIMIQIDAANKYPRDLTTFTDNCVALATRNNKTALSCIYCRPVGKDKAGKATFAVGPSVRLTEIMQGFWKHIRAGYTIEVQGDKIHAKGICVDMENNISRYAEASKTVARYSENQKDVAAKGLGSIVVRDAILMVIGRAYADEVSEQIMESVLSDAEGAWQHALSVYAELNVQEKELCDYFKIPVGITPDREVIWKAIGIYNYLKDSGETPDYVFGGDRKPSKPNVTPDMVKEVKRPEQTKAKPKHKESPQDVLDVEEFKNMVFKLSLSAGLKITEVNNHLNKHFGFACAEDVTTDKQNVVLDYFTALADQ